MKSVLNFDLNRLLTTTRAMQGYQLLRMGSVLLTSVLLAKSGLGTADIGIYEMLLYVSSTVTFFWMNGLLLGIVPIYNRLPESERGTFLFELFLLFSVLGVLLYAGLFVGEGWVTPFLTGQERLPYFHLFILYLLFHLPSFPVEHVYLVREQPRALIGWGIATFVLHLVAVGLPLFLGLGLSGSLGALLGLAVLKWGWTLWLVWPQNKAVFLPERLRAYVSFSFPLILSSLTSNLIFLFDNWLVNWYYQDEAVFALYRYGSRELPLATALATALGTALVPRLMADRAAGLEEIKTKSRRLFHSMFLLTIALLFSSDWLFPRVFNAEFEKSAGLFNIYLLLTSSRLLLPGSIALAMGANRVILGVGILELLVKVISGFLFIQWWGLPGLAWSVVLSYWVEKLGLMAWLEWKAGVPTHRWLDMRWYLFYVIVLVLAFIWVES